MRAVAVAMAALTLSACWSGPPLFQTRDAVAAIADGDYIVREPRTAPGATPPPGPEGEEISIRRQPDGALLVRAGGGPDTEEMRVLAVPLTPASERRFVLQIAWVGEGPMSRNLSYMLLDTRKSPARLIIPSCSAAARAAAEDSGGSVSRDPNSATQCSFTDRTVLLALLQRFATEASTAKNQLELVPVKGR